MICLHLLSLTPSHDSRNFDAVISYSFAMWPKGAWGLQAGEALLIAIGFR